MKIKLKNLGVLKQAEFELGDMTIICGQNNTGKTYATYALYGFLSFWEEVFIIEISRDRMDELLSEGNLRIDLTEYTNKAQTLIDRACQDFSKLLPWVFASSDKLFGNSKICICLDKAEIQPLEQYESKLGSAHKKDLLLIRKEPEASFVEISLLVDSSAAETLSRDLLQRSVGSALKEILFARLFTHPFIASAERTGVAIFRKELDFARNRLLEQMSLKRDLNPFELLDKVYTDYALPVRENVDFTRRLEDIAKKESFIAKEHPEVLTDFANIIGGEYKVNKNGEELYYIPRHNKQLRLTMTESSSAVRSLLDIGFFLRHVVQPSDLLVVDEPELNLHPENQRWVARLFARLVNLGVKVFITTHSDYIIKELNTLIMLNHDKLHTRTIREKKGYRDQELLQPGKLRVYIAKKRLVLLDGNKRKTSVPTLVKADIDQELGIQAESFDKTIDEMNRLQKAILFGRDI